MTMKSAKRRLDYQAPRFYVEHVELEFSLSESNTRVYARLRVTRNGEHDEPLILDGESLKLRKLQLDGSAFNDYQETKGTLKLNHVPNRFELETWVSIDPSANSSLEGLYVSDGAFCTQCEAEGFRKITYFIDRPDVLATYDVKITADSNKFPKLLSNGNLISQGSNDDGTHWVQWQDPFKKPCYLFALVAGDFDCLYDTFVTQSGREVALELYVDKGKLGRGSHAMASLKRSMEWDEKTFNLEYDLDIYMIVAVDFFNMGAMENKGLNVFNSKFVLADDKSATDEDFFNIESVIAHEYFHNWSGNRVTCRDWFQLSLKEGLTVFRDQLFSETYNSALSTRIKQVKVVREHQFAEDAGPMSHPIRPDEVIEMNNFYTVTVYDKGAEVIRMLWTLLGQEGFKRGLALYFSRFDGQAVTCDDFVDAMQSANTTDLTLFKRWYSQSGTPRVSVDVNANNQIVLSQCTQPTADQKEKASLHIPLNVEILSDSGDVLVKEQVSLQEASLTTSFIHQPGSTIIANSQFGAPVLVDANYDEFQLANILKNAKHDFDRWEAGQALFKFGVKRYLAGDVELAKNTASTFFEFMQKSTSELELLSEVMQMPSVEAIMADSETVDIDGLVKAHKFLCENIAECCSPVIDKLLARLMPRPKYQYESEQIIQRSALNTLLKLAAYHQPDVERIEHLFSTADNMTDSLSSLQAAQIASDELFEKLMLKFEQQWSDDALVLDKWFALHATHSSDDILARLQLLMQHKQFSIRNPNRIRAILGSFAFYNTPGLHHRDGSGYRFMVDYLLMIDPVNPQVAARIVTPLLSWKKLDEQRQDLVKTQLVRLLDFTNLSADLYEKVSKSLSS